MEGKNSFLLYKDQHLVVKELPDDIAGRLFKTILAYVNDENPDVDELLLKVTFEPIKNQLKRDLKTWESTIEKRSKAGKASAEKRQHMSTHVDTKEQVSTVYVTDTVTVIDTVTVNEKKKEGDKSPNPPKEKKIKVEFVPPTFEEFEKYCDENGFKTIALRAFKGYSDAAPPWTDSKGNKILSWKQKLQNVWFTEKNKNEGSKTVIGTTATIEKGKGYGKL